MKRLRRLQINNEFDLGYLDDWKIAGLFAFQNPRRIRADL